MARASELIGELCAVLSVGLAFVFAATGLAYGLGMYVGVFVAGMRWSAGVLS